MKPAAQPSASSVAERAGSRLNFEAVPWALCLAVLFTACPTSLVLRELTAPGYPFWKSGNRG
jgi:hypothetical protein